MASNLISDLSQQSTHDYANNDSKELAYAMGFTLGWGWKQDIASWLIVFNIKTDCV